MINIPDQPIMARFGESVFLTEFITPKNPDVMLAFKKLATSNLDETIWNLWQYVATFPYQAVIPSVLYAGGLEIKQQDTWFYPAETMQVKLSNCANRSFLLTSLLKNAPEIAESVLCVFGQIGRPPKVMGNHAWVQLAVGGKEYYIETTAPNLPRALIPLGDLMYDPFVYFDQRQVFVTDNERDLKTVFNGSFTQPGAIDWLSDYLSRKALSVIQY